VTGSGCDVIEALYHHACVTELKEPTKNFSISLSRQSFEPGTWTALILLYHSRSGLLLETISDMECIKRSLSVSVSSPGNRMLWIELHGRAMA
jgi:hypothetical protein